jgi:EAL domain-containing protein (putative c-di-GMP-specific phosphodiesterase class I)
VTVSIGLAPFDPPDATPAEMLAAADLAMFAAKEAGRDRRATAATDVRSGRDAAGRTSWVERIEAALHNSRFALLAQPVVSLRDGMVAQFELFVRLVDDDELVTPERFLYLAERVDLVGLIDAWVVGRAIEVLNERADEPFALSVNLAQRSLGSPAVRELLARRLARPRFDPSRLVLEIGERSAMASIAATQRFLDLAASLGCATALDDFGAGLGSLSYLKYLPFDFLKIDGAVVATCATNAVDRTLVSAIAAVAGELGRRTIAEATPDQATLDLLRRAGVDYAQGYFIGRPQPMDAVFPAGRPAATFVGT